MSIVTSPGPMWLEAARRTVSRISVSDSELRTPAGDLDHRKCKAEPRGGDRAWFRLLLSFQILRYGPGRSISKDPTSLHLKFPNIEVMTMWDVNTNYKLKLSY